MVAVLSLPLKSGMDPSASCAISCTDTFAVKFSSLSRTPNIIEVRSTLVLFDGD